MAFFSPGNPPTNAIAPVQAHPESVSMYQGELTCGRTLSYEITHHLQYLLRTTISNIFLEQKKDVSAIDCFSGYVI